MHPGADAANDGVVHETASTATILCPRRSARTLRRESRGSVERRAGGQFSSRAISRTASRVAGARGSERRCSGRHWPISAHLHLLHSPRRAARSSRAAVTPCGIGTRARDAATATAASWRHCRAAPRRESLSARALSPLRCEKLAPWSTPPPSSHNTPANSYSAKREWESERPGHRSWRRVHRRQCVDSRGCSRAPATSLR